MKSTVSCKWSNRIGLWFTFSNASLIIALKSFKSNGNHFFTLSLTNFTCRTCALLLNSRSDDKDCQFTGIEDYYNPWRPRMRCYNWLEFSTQATYVMSHASVKFSSYWKDKLMIGWLVLIIRHFLQISLWLLVLS